MERKIVAYCDGGCRGNNNDENIGGYGVTIKAYLGEKETIYGEYKGGYVNTTNNKMELMAAITSLKETQKHQDIPIEIRVDSAYVLNGITKWIKGWMKKNWINSKKEPVKNKDLWLELYELTKDREVSFTKVKGHSGEIGNERADELANMAMDEKEAVISE